MPHCLSPAAKDIMEFIEKDIEPIVLWGRRGETERVYRCLEEIRKRTPIA